MKPTHYHRSQRGSRPLTDFDYHAPLEESAAAATKTPAPAETPKHTPFWKIGAATDQAESLRDYVFELALVGIIGIAAAWPILFMLVSITRLVRNY